MKKSPRKLILCCPLCPGDIMTMTVAVHSLHEAYPGEYLTDVRTACPDIWQNNPWITPIADNDPDVTRIQMEYPQINRSNQTSINFLSCYTEFLGERIGRPLYARSNRPLFYLTDEEKARYRRTAGIWSIRWGQGISLSPGWRTRDASAGTGLALFGGPTPRRACSVSGKGANRCRLTRLIGSYSDFTPEVIAACSRSKGTCRTL